MATTKVILEGPLFTGRADQAAHDFADSLANEVAEIGKTWIQVASMEMDRSGRGGTGRAAAGVEGPAGSNGAYKIWGGIRTGQYAWPWLEGTSKRNQSTSFHGYHTFRRTRLRMKKQVTPFAQAKLEQYLLLMGGSET